MAFDAPVSLRIINNERLRRSLGWGEYRDLRGALALTSDAPTEDLNHIESFTADERTIDDLLDIGFALLRAFDREPAAYVTPLDRPASLEERLRRRGLAPSERTVAMVHRGGVPAARAQGVRIRGAEPDDARTVADIVAAGGQKWLKPLMLKAVLAGVLEPGHTFYLADVDGQAAGTVHLLVDGATAGIYGVATLKAHRRRGICAALLAAAIADARAAGCDVIGLRTAIEGPARQLFESAGFEEAHTAVLWVGP
jgi:N-acetylglutamate synthase-like GNAT family acetyltransferase